MNIAYETWILGVVFFFVVVVVLFALWRGDQVETGFQFFRLQLFLRYRRNRRK